MDSPLNTIHPQKFRGTVKEDASDWLRHFENYCSYKQYEETKIKAFFRVMLVDRAATWLDSLTQETQDDWSRLKNAFLTRYTTPEFLRYKQAKKLFNYEQEAMPVSDYLVHMKKLAREVGTDEKMLYYAALNGLRAELKYYVTMKQPKTWDELVEAAKIGELCEEVDPTARILHHVGVLC